MAASSAIVALGLGLVPAVARADGDPASDVLVTQPAFVPWDAGVSLHQAAQLNALLKAAARAGMPVRVALIASATDLGSITPLWRRPLAYADFLGQELSLVYHGRVLVVMPVGLGMYENGHLLALPAGAAASAARGNLAARATAVVQELAKDAGKRLAPVAVSAPAIRSVAHTPAAAVAFVIGLILIAIAWAVSLHVRPPEGRLGRFFTS